MNIDDILEGDLIPFRGTDVFRAIFWIVQPDGSKSVGDVMEFKLGMTLEAAKDYVNRHMYPPESLQPNEYIVYEKRIPGKGWVPLGESVVEAAMQRQEHGLGFEVWYGEKIALAGGMRSGSSPPGLLRCAYTIIDTQAMEQGVPQDKADVGLVEIFKDDNNEIRGLINIKLNKNNRRSGIGSEAVRSLIDSCPSDFTVWDIRKTAIGFWKKMGCEFYNSAGKPIPDPRKFTGVIVGLIRKPGSTGTIMDLPGFSHRRASGSTKSD